MHILTALTRATANALWRQFGMPERQAEVDWPAVEYTRAFPTGEAVRQHARNLGTAAHNYLTEAGFHLSEAGALVRGRERAWRLCLHRPRADDWAELTNATMGTIVWQQAYDNEYLWRHTSWLPGVAPPPLLKDGELTWQN